MGRVAVFDHLDQNTDGRAPCGERMSLQDLNDAERRMFRSRRVVGPAGAIARHPGFNAGADSADATARLRASLAP
jgi:hypothetical protein